MRNCVSTFSSILAPSLRQKIQDFEPDLPVQKVQSMTDAIADSLWLKRLSATLIGLVAVSAIAWLVREYTA
jgi:hypothetical protein